MSFADTSLQDGFPDEACAPDLDDILSSLNKPGQIAQYSNKGLVSTISAGSEQPSDCCFAGQNLDRLFVVSIKVEFGHGQAHPP